MTLDWIQANGVLFFHQLFHCRASPYWHCISDLSHCTVQSSSASFPIVYLVLPFAPGIFLDGFLPHGSIMLPNSPNTSLYSSFKLWRFLRRFIYLCLLPQELFQHGFLLHGSIRFCNIPNALSPSLIQTSLFWIAIYKSFGPLNGSNTPFPVFLLLLLILAYFSPSSSPLLLNLIQP